MQKFLLFFLVLCSFSCSFSAIDESDGIRVGSERTTLYLPGIINKNVAVMANQSSMINRTHLVDSLISLKVEIKKIFSPEHGFRGDEEAGAIIENELDPISRLPVISLYGKDKKPTENDLKDIDVVLFDLQDVGTRFYTYISSLHYLMEACAESGKKLIILDRPNPNGDYIDGPILEKEFTSFVGMHPIPVLHGMTIGEYAKMINGEGWLKNSIKCNLEIIPCQNYSHSMKYAPPVRPSPNLPDFQAIRLYPSLCFFEGTVVSIGRGTDFPFKVYGNPEFDSSMFSFKPKRKPGFAVNPKHKEELCYGVDLRNYPVEPGDIKALILDWLISAYNSYPEKDKFFTSYFEKLAGTAELRKQIEEGWSKDKIKAEWKDGLNSFLKTREKYLIYPSSILPF